MSFDTEKYLKELAANSDINLELKLMLAFNKGWTMGEKAILREVESGEYNIIPHIPLSKQCDELKRIVEAAETQNVPIKDYIEQCRITEEIVDEIIGKK